MRTKALIMVFFILGGLLGQSQSVKWSAEDIIALTPDWKGERTPDGRPRVPDELLEKLKGVSMEEAWSFLESKGYKNQFENFASIFENGWQIIHPEQVMTGRAVTAQFMPLRKDFDNYIQKVGKKENLTSPVTNYAPINALGDGDIYVADSYGKMSEGTLIGDNLGNAIYARSKRGIIFNGSVRDVEGLSEIKGFNGWIRGSDPTGIDQMVCATINAPIRIGRVTVLPGDAIVAKTTGVVFIPPHLVAELVLSGELTKLRDEFSHYCIQTKKFEYNNEHFVNVTREEYDKAFMEWLDNYPDLPVSRKELDDYMKAQKAEYESRKAKAQGK